MSNVSTEEIKSIKPGATEAFHCDATKMRSLATALSDMKRYRKMPEGIVAYEHITFPEKNIVVVRAMREGEEKVFNR
jgi:hypothetical protein